MPAKSKKQQRFFGMVHARQKGEKVGGSEVAKVAKEIDFDDAEDFASTKHKGLPEKVKKKKSKKKKDKEDKMDESKTLWQQYVERREMSEAIDPNVAHAKRLANREALARHRAKAGAGRNVGGPKPIAPAPKPKPHPEFRSSEYDPEDIAAQERKHGSRCPFHLSRKYMGHDVIKVPPHVAARQGQEVEPGTGGDPKRPPHTLLGRDDIVRNPPPHRGPQSLVP